MISAYPTVHAATYGRAIKIIGKQMDLLWGNGNWSLLSCKATPIRNMADEVLTWEWSMHIEWHGQETRAEG